MGIDPFTLFSIASAASGVLGFAQQRKARKAAESAEAAAAEQTAQIAATLREKPAMPSPDDEATRRAKRRSIAAQMRRRGRASTILTSPEQSDVLGA